jgi:protein phosphatase
VNEDSVVESGNIFGVADGMGGHRAGEVASELALSLIQQYIEDNLGVLSGDKMVEKALAAANASVFLKAASSARYHAMGTTVTVLYREGGTAFIGHVGDSRAYLYRGGSLRKLTGDHSLVASLVEEGQITEEEARTHPQRNIILRALGLERQVEADVVAVEIQRGDQFLLATDGLTGLVDDEGIEAVLASESDPKATARKLVDAALQAGGSDNVSVVIARFDESETLVPSGSAAGAEGGKTVAGGNRRARRWLAITIALVAVIAACISAGLYFYNKSYFVGAHDGKVVLYKGFPFWGLASVKEKTDVDVKLLTASNQRKVNGNMEVESREEAVATLRSLVREARNYTLVPDVVGKIYKQAKKLIEDEGLRVLEPPELVSSENARVGTVFQQSPDAYSRVGRGTGVRLKVVSGKATRGV